MTTIAFDGRFVAAICEHLSRELHVIKTALTESEATEHKLRDRIARLRSRIQALEEALAFYAAASSWQAQGHSQIDADTAPIVLDKGSRARSVLTEKELPNG